MILIHKKTHGALSAAVEDTGGRLIPRGRLSCAALGLDPAAWWQVGENTVLARKVMRYYPCFDAVTAEDGSLLDVVAWGKKRIKRLEQGVPTGKKDWRHTHDRKSRLYRERGMVKVNKWKKFPTGGGACVGS